MKTSNLATALATSMAMYTRMTAATWTIGDCTYEVSLTGCNSASSDVSEAITVGELLFLVDGLENNFPISDYQGIDFVANDMPCGSDTCQGVAQIVGSSVLGGCEQSGVATILGLLWNECGAYGGVAGVDVNNSGNTVLVTYYAILSSSTDLIDTCDEGTTCVTCDGNCTVGFSN